jgi:hypothetical protein
VRLAGHEALMREIRNAYKIIGGNLEDRDQLGDL